METGPEESLRQTVAAPLRATGEPQRVLASVLGPPQAQVSRRRSAATSWSLHDADILAAHHGLPAPDLLAGTRHAGEPGAHR
ncbi:XRE family transcriptional regulator [Streptomyces sp. NPDC092307]|uniref:XRE family transcriptional regulator n=1 Tax=Streptomyces sp. NPDC092307 TaxID=3366013 RepID=UPI0037FEED96